VLLLSAGVGVTPVLSMLHSLVKNGATRPVWWLHGARDSSEHAFAQEARELLKRLPNSHSHVYYTRPKPTDRRGVDYTEQGRLSVGELRRLGLPRNAQAFLCGPASFMEEISQGLAACGLEPAAIHSQVFGAHGALTPGIATELRPPHLPEGPAGSGPEIQFARSALSAPWGPGYSSLLEFAEACDVPTRWSCRTGVCHNCETALLSGQVRYDLEPLQPPAQGNILVCISTPSEPIVVDL
jgi:ferredoxin-NADP reductase